MESDFYIERHANAALPQDARQLRSLAEMAGTRWLGGLVLHRGSDISRLAEPGIWALPFWRLWSPP